MALDIPTNLQYLLERPFYGSLALVRPDGSPQVNPMWFQRVGDTIHFTHTSKRAKYRYLQANPAMSFLVFDPDDPMIYLEVRGSLLEVIPDPTGSFYMELQERYGYATGKTPHDAPDRVILVMSMDAFAQH